MTVCFIGGWVNSYLYSNYLRKKNKGWLFWFALIWLGAIITFDFLIYVNIIKANWFLWPWIQIPNGVDPGKYWMFNPFLMFGIQLKSQIIPDAGFVWDIFALFFLISYIWWFIIGQNLGRVMYGRLEYEKGIWYLFRKTKRIKIKNEAAYRIKSD